MPTDKLAGTEQHVVTLSAALVGRGVDVKAVVGGERLAEGFAERGIEVSVGEFSYRSSPRNGWLLRRAIAGADVVHAHLTAAAFAAVTATAVVPRPVVETMHFTALASSAGAPARRLAGRAVRGYIDRRLAAAIAPSSAVARSWRSVTDVVPHGVDLPALETASANGHGPTRFCVVGRLEDEKCVGDILHAFKSALTRAGVPGRLDVVGDGSRRSDLETLAAGLGLGDSTTFHGWVADPWSVAAGADMLVHAGREEGFGLVLVEALARGVPVLARARGAASEIVTPGVTGALFDDPGQLVSEMTIALRDQERARGLRRKARLEAEQRFSAERMAEETECVYRRVSGNVGGSGRRVLRAYHSAVVPAWRRRDEILRGSGHDIELVTARRWNEGGAEVRRGDAPSWVTHTRTFGTHPNLFLYDPRPFFRKLRRQRWDVIDIHEEPVSLAAAEIRLARRLFAPHVPYTLYSAQNLEKRYPWPFRWLERRALHGCSAAFVCNREAGEILDRKGLAGSAHYIPLGVDIAKFTEAGDRGGGGPLRIGYVGRLEEHKGVAVLIRAVAATGVSLTVVGAGPQESELRALAERLHADVTFTGYLQQGRLPEVIRTFDVVAVPSLPRPNWTEQFCRVAVESMASGVPILASRTGALPDVVGPGGWLVPPGNVDAFAARLGAIDRDRETLRSVAATASEWAQQYSWEQVAELHGRMWDEVAR